MVPHVKGVEVYEESKLANVHIKHLSVFRPTRVTTNVHANVTQFAQGSTITGAKFSIGVMGMNIRYYLKLRHEPKYNTLSWTLDFRHTSDIGTNLSTCIATFFYVFVLFLC